MSDPSLPQGSPELPRQFSFSLPVHEIIAVRDYADRYAPVPAFEYCVLVSFFPGKHQWFMSEMNLLAWFEYEGVGPHAGTLVIPVQHLNLMSAMGADEQEINIRIDLDKLTLSFEIDRVDTTIDLPNQYQRDWTSSFDNSLTIRAETSHLVKLGRAMMSHPINLPVEGLEDAPWPFIDFAFNGTTLSCTRNWTRFGGPKVAVEIPASGSYRGDFSCMAEPIARELFYADLSDGDEVTFAFNSEHPNFIHITGESWGIKTGLAQYHVYEYRPQVVRNLVEEEIVVVDDPRIGWDPVVHCNHLDHEVTATILCGDNNESHFVRLACVVVSDAPWNLQMAEEMNSWNNMWANSKLVREEDNLLVMADVPVTSLEVLGNSVRDLVTKAHNVRDVVAVFM